MKAAMDMAGGGAGGGSAEALWDAERAAAYLNVSVSWVYKAVARGVLPHLRVINLLRFDPEQLKAFVQGSAAKPPRLVNIPPR